MDQSTIPPSSVPFVVMRGGTSRGIFFRREDVPADRDTLESVLLDVFGSPDVRQIDGLGGADPLTSKAAILGLPSDAGADVEYLHGQVGIREPHVDFELNCGNLTAAAASLAITWGLVAPVDGVTTVRVRSAGTGALITARVPVSGSRVVEQGDFEIAGVPGAGARIDLDFAQTAGQRTGQLFPTGSRSDAIVVPSLGEIQISVLDLGNLVTFVRLEDLGISPQMLPAEVEADLRIWEVMHEIRRQVAEHVGLDAGPGLRTAVNPMMVAVAAPDTYQTLSGVAVPPESFVLTCRQLRSAGVHKALTGSAGTCTAVASRIPGTVPYQVRRHDTAPTNEEVRLGHPSGVMAVRCVVDLADEDRPTVREALLARTARRIAEGRAFLKSQDPATLPLHS